MTKGVSVVDNEVKCVSWHKGVYEPSTVKSSLLDFSYEVGHPLLGRYDFFSLNIARTFFV